MFKTKAPLRVEEETYSQLVGYVQIFNPKGAPACRMDRLVNLPSL